MLSGTPSSRIGDGWWRCANSRYGSHEFVTEAHLGHTQPLTSGPADKNMGHTSEHPLPTGRSQPNDNFAQMRPDLQMLVSLTRLIKGKNTI
jgi:hypothetical protein